MLQRRLIDFKEHPRTAAENAFLSLQARKEILEDQLRSLSNRRDELANNLDGRTGADKEGVEARLRSLDAQIQATDTELGSVTKDLAQAAVPSYAESVQRIYEGFNRGDVVGAGFAGAGIMFALFIPLIYRTFRRRRWVPPGTSSTQTSAIGGERIERMEMAIDSIAVEMERVSENQRFMTRLMTETQLAGTIAAVRGSTEAARAAAENSNG
jgi:hypothetical protein